jgi:transposase
MDRETSAHRLEALMARSRNGQAVAPERRTPEAVAELEAFGEQLKAAGDLKAWVRARAILSYIGGERVVVIARHLGIGRTTVNDWLRWYAREGIEGLRTGKPGRSEPRLKGAQREELARRLDAGPLAAGLETAMWTGKSVAAVILREFGVTYHPQSVPRLLHEMGYSVQRPRKRLARADPVAQATWAQETFPALGKKPRRAAG